MDEIPTHDPWDVLGMFFGMILKWDLVSSVRVNGEGKVGRIAWIFRYSHTAYPSFKFSQWVGFRWKSISWILFLSTIEAIVEYRMPQQWPQHNKLPILLYLRSKPSGLISATNMPIKIACISVYMFYEEKKMQDSRAVYRHIPCRGWRQEAVHGTVGEYGFVWK